METYALKTAEGFFSYESGHYVCNASFTTGSHVRAETWKRPENKTDQILKAMEHARKKGFDPKLVKVKITLEETDFDLEDQVRQNALDKLTEEEKKALDIAS